MKPLLVGQAPARSGDGRPFTGRSGERLCRLLGLPGYDALCDALDMTNLVPEIQPRLQRRGDPFNVTKAKVAAINLMTEQKALGRGTIICAGLKVWDAFGCPDDADWFDGHQRRGMTFWKFPHPSGASAFWNHRRDVEEASQFLRSIVLTR